VPIEYYQYPALHGVDRELGIRGGRGLHDDYAISSMMAL
jgi:hypothetical protein